MNIKKIADKVYKEADVSLQNYPIADLIDDINEEYLTRVEQATQIGSTEPISNAETISEEFTTVVGSNVFARTIKDTPIVRVDFKHTGASHFETVPEDQTRQINGWLIEDQRFFANEKQFFVEDAHAGTVRVTYAHGEITQFTVADYELASGNPSPDWLDQTFHPLLWLFPAMNAAAKYKPDRYEALKLRFDRLDTLFYNRYARNSATDLMIENGDEIEGNYR